jgi:hypothetical protein
MKNILIILMILFVQRSNSQDFKYSFISNLKAYQEIDGKGDVIDSTLWERTNTKVTITQENCRIEENGVVKEFQVLSSELKKDNLTRIEIKAIKNKIKYEIELALINRKDFFFLIKESQKTQIYKINKINKTIKK